MAAVNIVIRAVNSTKAAFQEAGNQAEGLNKRLQKIGNVFKGLFVGGILVQFGKKLLEASSYGKQLEESGKRVKSAWSGVSTDVGDAFARIVLSLEGPIKAIGNFLDGIIDKLQYAAAYTTALVSTQSFEEASRIAAETVEQIKAEQDARRAANQEAEAGGKAESDDAKYLNELYEERFKLSQQLTAEKKKAREADMTPEELLKTREAELAQKKQQANATINFPGLSAEQNAAINDVAKIETEIDIVNLEQEIKKIRDGINAATAEADKKILKPGTRIIKFNRDAIKMGDKAGDLQRRTDARMKELAKTDPSWKSANYLKDINDKIDALLSLKD